MGSTICTDGFASAAIASSCFTARCDSIWYGFFIATLLFLGKRNCSQPIKGFERGSRYFLRSTGHSPEHHLALKPRRDYLIITTNYDRLTEIALEKTEVPYCVLTVGSADQYVDVRFSPHMQEYLELTPTEFASLKKEHSRKYAKYFNLDLPRPIAIVYKLHGCLFPEEPGRDSVVLSDEDYIRYLMQMYDASGMIPSEITTQMASAAFLFLGYSFSDWNVRGMYKAVVKQRTVAQMQEVRDFAVVRDFSAYETAFCREGNGRIHLLVTDLARFTRQLMQYAPRRAHKRRQKT